MEYINPYSALGWTENFEFPSMEKVRKHINKVLVVLSLEPKVKVAGGDRVLTLQDVRWCQAELSDKDKSEAHWEILIHKQFMLYLSKKEIENWEELNPNKIKINSKIFDIFSEYFSEEFSRRITNCILSNDINLTKKLSDFIACQSETVKTQWTDAAEASLKLKYVEPIKECCEKFVKTKDYNFINNLIKLCKIDSITILPNFFQDIRNNVCEIVRSCGVQANNEGLKDLEILKKILSIAVAFKPNGQVGVTLNNNIEQVKEIEKSRKEHISNYLIDITYGSIKKDHFELTENNLIYNDTKILLDDISWIKAGQFRVINYGIPSNKSSLINIGTKKGEIISIECVKIFEDKSSEVGKRFSLIYGKLLAAVGDRLFNETIAAMDRGAKVSFGNTLVTSKGIALGSEIIEWKNLIAIHSNGKLFIEYMNSRIAFSSMDVPNLFILETLLEMHGVTIPTIDGYSEMFDFLKLKL